MSRGDIFFPFENETHMGLGAGSLNAVQRILLPVFVWSHLESKLRVSTVTQWPDSSLDAIKKKKTKQKNAPPTPPFFLDGPH